MKLKKIIKICSCSVSLGAIALAGTAFYFPTTSQTETTSSPLTSSTTNDKVVPYSIDYFKPVYDLNASQWLDENGWITLGTNEGTELSTREGASYKQVFLTDEIAMVMITAVKATNPSLAGIDLNTPVLASDLESITTLNLDTILSISSKYTCEELLVGLFGNPNVQHWSKLSSLSLQNNELWNLPTGIFGGICQTTKSSLSLDLSSNQLTYFTGDEFGPGELPEQNLTLKLTLNDNHITYNGKISSEPMPDYIKANIKTYLPLLTDASIVKLENQTDIINLSSAVSGKTSGDLYNVITDSGRNVNIWPEDISKDTIIEELNSSERCSRLVTSENLTLTSNNMNGSFKVELNFANDAANWEGDHKSTFSETIYFNALYIGLVVDSVFLVLTALGLYFAISSYLKTTKKNKK